MSEYWMITTLVYRTDQIGGMWLTELDTQNHERWHSISEQLVRDFVSPVIAECDERELITSFHFTFGMPCLNLRLRCTDETNRSQVENVVREKFAKVASIAELRPLDHNYHGEAAGYGGEENWLVMEQFLEASSRFFIRRTIAGETLNGGDFHKWKFIHMFLNCSNLVPPLEECQMLVSSFCERMKYWNENAPILELRGRYDRTTSRKWLESFFAQSWPS